MKHFFLVPSLQDRRYKCGGLMIFVRTCELVSRQADTEIITYRHRESPLRYLDDVPRDELQNGMVWICWQPHFAELAERLSGVQHVVPYLMNTDYGSHGGEHMPEHWPLVCLSRYIAADYAVKQHWRHISYLGPVLHAEARNRGGTRDIDVLVHLRKNTRYVRDMLIPALQKRARVEVLDGFIPQEAFLALLNRCHTYLYWVHKQIPGVWIHEGFGLQPLEAIACGCLPVANFYGGLSDYLEAPHNCCKIGTHSMAFDVEHILAAAAAHNGHNPDEERVHELYSETRFAADFAQITQSLAFYFSHTVGKPHDVFDIEPPRIAWWRQPREWLYQRVMRAYKRSHRIRPT